MPSSRVTLPGSLRKRAIYAENLGPANPAEQAYVTVVVRRKTEPLPITAAGARADRQQYASTHGATASDLLAVGEFAKEYGLETRNENAATRSVELHGRLGDLSRAFDVSLTSVRIKDQIHRVRDGEITLPIDLAGIVQAVLGLDNRPAARSFIRKRVGGGERAANAAHALSAWAVAELYNFPINLDGSGQTIAIVELDGGYLQQDLAAYFGNAGLPTPAVSAVLLDGQTNKINKHLPAHPELNADDEVALDIEIAGAIAPKAKQVVYFAQNTDQSFLKAINTAIRATPAPVAVSISWGMAESEFADQAKITFEQALQDAANLGIPVCIASGDNGSFDETGALAVNFPASAPHALACGGTTLIGSGGTISSETVWNSLSSDGTGKPVRVGTGGGVSTFFSKPTYQDAANVPDRPSGFGAGRGVPDVAGNADPNTGYTIHVKGADTVVGGTSAVAPLLAGLIARFGQRLQAPVGFLHPRIYDPSLSQAGFQDITVGDNDSQGKGGLYQAAPGWDACTGLGSPNGYHILQALAASTSLPTPTPTPVSAPTPFPHPTLPPPTPTPLPPTPTPFPPTPVPSPHPTHTGTTVGEALAPPAFSPLPPPEPRPVPRAPVSSSILRLSSSTSAPGSSAVAITSVIGLAAIVGMVATAAVVATVAISHEDRE